MQEQTGKIEGDFLVDQEIIFRGMVTGTVTVSEGGVLNLRGMICKDLILEKNSIVELRGMVNGNVFNKGGNLEVFGMIVGALHKEGGTTFVDEKAMIQNKK